MKFFDFEKKILDTPIFTAKEASSLFFKEENLLNQIAFWTKKGYIEKLAKGVYVLSKYKKQINPLILANKLYRPSYVSLEYALNFYSFIPDVPSVITSVSSRKTKSFNTSLGLFNYQKIKKNFFTGYTTLKDNNYNYSIKIADKEKAIIDYLYLHKNQIKKEKEFFKEMRIDKDNKLNSEKINYFLNLLEDKKTNLLMDKFLNYYKNVG